MRPQSSRSGLWTRFYNAGEIARDLHREIATKECFIAYSPDAAIVVRSSDREFRPGRGFAIVGNLAGISVTAPGSFSLVLISCQPSAYPAHITDCIVSPVTPVFRLLRGYTSIALQSLGQDPELDVLILEHLEVLAKRLSLPEDGTFARGPGKASSKIARVLETIRSNALDPDFTLGTLAALENVTPRCLQQYLALARTSFTSALNEARLQKALELLSRRSHLNMTIGAVAFAAGFNDISTFNRHFKRRFGYPPSSIVQP